MTPDDWAWCIYRNGVQGSYREVRHVGPPGSRRSRLVLDGDMLAVARACATHRSRLEDASLFVAIAKSRDVDEVVATYKGVTGLDLDDLAPIFRHHGWTPGYGGEKWAAIAEGVSQLRNALRSGVGPVAAARDVASLRHNSDSLVPALEAWNESEYIRQKWPCWCEDEPR